jgi:6-pyruvoyltetrahydropterin/6-carboxytetrahydropterin synthase
MLQQFYPVKTHNFNYELNKDMNFAAAHFIDHSSAGKCQNVHGHTYFVNVTIVGNELQDNGFLVNFQQLKSLVHGKYDHTVMNDSDDFKAEEPSTEVVAKAIYKNIEKALMEYNNNPKVLQVIVRETPTSYVTYSEPLEYIHDIDTAHTYTDNDVFVSKTKDTDWSEW